MGCAKFKEELYMYVGVSVLHIRNASPMYVKHGDPAPRHIPGDRVFL